MRNTGEILGGIAGQHIPMREVYKTYPGGDTRTVDEKTGKLSRKPRKGASTGRKNGRLNIPMLVGKSGVYAIFEQAPRWKEPTLVYIGMSKSNLYATVSRHFQNWHSSKGNYKARISYVHEVREGYKFFVECVTTPPDEAHRIEVGLIKKFRPPHNGEKYNHIEETERIERMAGAEGIDLTAPPEGYDPATDEAANRVYEDAPF